MTYTNFLLSNNTSDDRRLEEYLLKNVGLKFKSIEKKEK